jgi:DnaK suppressor protein
VAKTTTKSAGNATSDTPVNPAAPQPRKPSKSESAVTKQPTTKAAEPEGKKAATAATASKEPKAVKVAKKGELSETASDPEVPVVDAASAAPVKAPAKAKLSKAKAAAEAALAAVPATPVTVRPPRKEVKKPEPVAPVSAAPAAKYPKINPDDEFEGIEKLSEPDFMGQQLEILRREMATYLSHSEMLRAEADHLAAEMEPGDVQFDDESGEGASASMEREKDLAMAAQKILIAEDIERAIDRVLNKVYGSCTNCFKHIPRVRLRAMPQATLCIVCKNGGLSRRS